LCYTKVPHMYGCSLMKRRSQSKNYQYRKRVPDKLRPIIQMLEITRSLDTPRKSDAKTFQYRIGLAVVRLFKEAERIRACGGPIPPKGWAKEFFELQISNLSAETANCKGTVQPTDSPTLTPRQADLVRLGLDESATYHDVISAEVSLYKDRLWENFDKRLDMYGVSSVVGYNLPHRHATLRALLDLYFGEFPRKGRTELIVRSHVNLFNMINNLNLEVGVHAITAEHVELYIQKIAKLPARRLGKKFEGLSIDEMIVLADKEKLPLMDLKTRKNRVDTIKAVFNYAKTHGYITENPFTGKMSKRQLKKIKLKKKKNIFFTHDELHSIFNGEWFAASPEKWGGKQWLLVISLYSGMRLEEIGQMRVDDVRVKDGISYFNLTETEFLIDEDEKEKRLKTESSEREVPIHPVLINLGILKYVEKMKNNRMTRVFPDIYSKQIEVTAAYSKAVNRYIDKCGIVSREKTFHTLRHTFIRQCRTARIDRDHHQAITGHADENVGDEYGGGFPIATLAEDIAKVCYGLDWERDYE